MASGTTTVPQELREGLVLYDDGALAAKVDAIWAKYGGYISQYCGAIPARLVAARIQIESNGNPAAVGKAQQWTTGYGSEIGLLQLSPDTRAQYNISDAQAKDPETNIKIGCAVWNSWVQNFFSEMSGVTADGVWAWLVTAIGPGAVRKLRSLAGGYDLNALLAVAGDASVMQANAGSWGSQGPALVAWRVGKAVSCAKAVGALGGGIGTLAGLVLGVAAYYLIRRWL